MKIAALLDNIDAGVSALPEFQRGYVWNREQVRGLMLSLYRRFTRGRLAVRDKLVEACALLPLNRGL